MNISEQFKNIPTHSQEFERSELFKIIEYPHPTLKKIAGPITEFGAVLEKRTKDMLLTMYYSPGIGLAAPQINLSERMFVVDVDYEREKILMPDGLTEYKYSDFNPHVFINPKIVEKEGEIIHEEGCLSLPGIFEKVKRFEKILVEYNNFDGSIGQLEAEGLLAICIQHENDHLDGIVFVERLSSFKQNFYKKKFLKSKKKK
jgi:peptide deformylase